jgi:hypothetical protein
MRLFSCLLAVSLPALLAVGCLTVDADECWPNTSGGLGGSKPIPIGAGVGATTGGEHAEPPRGPLSNGGAPENPCTAEETPKKPSPQSTCDVPTPSGEGATSWSCSEACSSKCPAPGMSFIVVDFSPSDFPFVTTIQDDGTDKGGGAQEAKVNLRFDRFLIPYIAETWYCPFRIEMPLRTEFMGKVSAKRAADFSEEITESVARDMLKSKVATGIFCTQFVPNVRAAFISKYKLLGARVIQ